MNIRLILYLFAAGIFIYSCNTNNPSVDPQSQVTLNAIGAWQLGSDDSVTMAIGVFENEDSNRVLICDMRTDGNGCMWGHLNKDNTISFDNSIFPDLSVEELFNQKLILSTANGSQLTVTGTYNGITWIQGYCGYYTITGTAIGIVDKNCIIGNWYTLETDPYGGPNRVVYKDYISDGTGKIIIPNENKTISFKWNISGYPTNTLLSEYQFSDTSYTDVSYGYECTATGLALGVQGKSWIRKNLVCY